MICLRGQQGLRLLVFLEPLEHRGGLCLIFQRWRSLLLALEGKPFSVSVWLSFLLQILPEIFTGKIGTGLIVYLFIGGSSSFYFHLVWFEAFYSMETSSCITKLIEVDYAQKHEVAKTSYIWILNFVIKIYCSAGIGVLNTARKTMARMLGNTETAFESAQSQFWVVDAQVCYGNLGSSWEVFYQ